MKKIISMLIVIGVMCSALIALVFTIARGDDTFRTYVDTSVGFSFEYPRELVPARAGNTVSFSDTPGGPFLISVRTLSNADAKREACLYTENPDNDPGIQKFIIENAGRTIIVMSRGVNPEHLRQSFRLIASQTPSTSAFFRKVQEVGLQGK